MAAAPPTLPPALRALLEAGGSLIRRSSTGRVALGRAAGVVGPDALPRPLRRLPDTLREARAEAATPLRPAEVERVLKDAWRTPPGKVLDELELDEPLAITAVAQVHRGVHEGRAVAVKVRRPGLVGPVRNDLMLLDTLAVPLRQVFGALDAGAMVREVRTTVLDELDFEHEASTQRRVRRALRGVAGVVVPAPDLALSHEDVLVAELLDGPTLAEAEPSDPAAVADALVDAHRAAARAGLVLPDTRPNHIILLDDGRVGLLGTGLARPADRERITAALDALAALRAGDADAFTSAVSRLDVLPPAAAPDAYMVLGDLLPERLDEPALAAAGERALDRLPAVLALAAVVTPSPPDLAAIRALGQLAATLARVA